MGGFTFTVLVSIDTSLLSSGSAMIPNQYIAYGRGIWDSDGSQAAETKEAGLVTDPVFLFSLSFFIGCANCKFLCNRYLTY